MRLLKQGIRLLTCPIFRPWASGNYVSTSDQHTTFEGGGMFFLAYHLKFQGSKPYKNSSNQGINWSPRTYTLSYFIRFFPYQL